MNRQLKLGGLRVTDERPHDRRHDGRPADVQCGVNILVGGVSALNTAKLGLRLPVGFLSAPATGAGMGGIRGVYKSKGYAIPDAAVLHKTAELVKRPSCMFRSLRLSKPYLFADTRQVLEFDTAPGAFSRFDKSFSDAVVFVLTKAGLTTREFFRWRLADLVPLRCKSALSLA